MPADTKLYNCKLLVFTWQEVNMEKKNYRIVKQVHISFRFRVHMDDCCKF